jgi:hypothetical protein
MFVFGSALLIAGILLMAVGLFFLSGWVSGPGESAAKRGHDEGKRGLYFYFFTMVITPLMWGAILIAFGLIKLM